MREFVHIPQALGPSEKEHVEHDLVFRATKNTDKLTVDDFYHGILKTKIKGYYLEDSLKNLSMECLFLQI